MPITSFNQPDSFEFEEEDDPLFSRRRRRESQPTEEDSFSPLQEISKGFSAGVEQEKALLGGAVRAGIGSAIGDEEMKQAGFDYYRERLAEAEKYAPTSGWDDDWDSLSDVGNFVFYTLGNAIPTLATTVAGGGVAGFAAKTGTKKFAKESLEQRFDSAFDAQFDEVAKGIVDDATKRRVANEYVEAVANKYGQRAAAVGAGATGTAFGFGESFASIYQETGLESPGTALVTGLVSGTLDSFGAPFRAIKAAFPDRPEIIGNLKDHIAKDVLTTEGGKRFGHMLSEGVKAAGREGVTEALQEFLVRSSVSFSSNFLSEEEQELFRGYLFNEEAISSYLHAGVAGSIAGTAFGGAVGAFKKVDGPDGETLDVKNEEDRQQNQVKAKKAVSRAAERTIEEIDLIESADTDTLRTQDTLESIQISSGITKDELAKDNNLSGDEQQEILDILVDQGRIRTEISGGNVLYFDAEEDAQAQPQAEVEPQPEPVAVAPTQPDPVAPARAQPEPVAPQPEPVTAIDRSADVPNQVMAVVETLDDFSIADVLRGTDLRFPQAKQALSQLETDGRVEVVPGGRYRVTRPEPQVQAVPDAPVQAAPDVEVEKTFEELVSENVDTLTAMAQEAGWESLGGKGIVSTEGESLGRTQWIPRAEWWREAQAGGKLPKNTEGMATRNAVAKAIAGDRLSAAETRHIESMLGTIQEWDEQAQRDAELSGLSESDADLPDSLITDIPEFDEDSPSLPDWDTLNEDQREAELDRIFGEADGRQADVADQETETGVADDGRRQTEVQRDERGATALRQSQSREDTGRESQESQRQEPRLTPGPIADDDQVGRIQPVVGDTTQLDPIETDRVDPTIAPLTDENRVIEKPDVENTNELGAVFKITYPESGNVYLVNQYARDAGGGFFAFPRGGRADDTIDVDSNDIQDVVTALRDVERQARATSQEASPRDDATIEVIQEPVFPGVPIGANRAAGTVTDSGSAISSRVTRINLAQDTQVPMGNTGDTFTQGRFGSVSLLVRTLEGAGSRGSPFVQADDSDRVVVMNTILDEYREDIADGRLEDSPETAQFVNSLLDMVERGMPIDFVTNTNGIYINPYRENVSGSFYPDSFAISVNPDLLSAAATDAADRARLLHVVTHEHWHLADALNNYSAGLPEFRMMQGVTTDAILNPDAVFALDVSDPVGQLYDEWSQGTELGREFHYPFANMGNFLADVAAESPDSTVAMENAIRVFEKEVFAQAGAVFIGNPDLLKNNASEIYNVFRRIQAEPLKTAGQLIDDQNQRTTEAQREPSGDQVPGDFRARTRNRSVQIPIPGRGRSDSDRSGGIRGAPQTVGDTTADQDGDASRRAFRASPVLDIKLEDLPSESQRLTATPVLYGDQPPRPVEGNPTVVKVAREFDNKAKEAYPDRDLSEQTDENAELVSDLIAHEAIQAIEREGNAGEWYQQKVANAMELAAQRYPELSSASNDPAPRFAFTAIMAVTSNGASVPENSLNTFRLYDEYRQNGEFSIFGVGKEGPAMKASFELLNALIKVDGIDSVIRFMDEDITVRDLENNFDLKVSGELQDTVLKGSAILGPKIGGGFYQNLNGNFDPLTMDRWFMRTYGRLTGSLMKEADRKYPIQLKKFRDIALSDEYRNKLRRDGIKRVQLKNDDEYAEAYVKRVQREYAKGGFKNKTEINLASNTFVSSQGETQAPQRGSEREYIRSVMQMALDKVNVSFPEVNMGALQAIIWYPEKQLYKLHGVGNKRSEPTDYETEFRKIIEGEEGRPGVPGSGRSTLEPGARGLQRTTGESDQDTDQPDSAAVQEPQSPSPVLDIQDPVRGSEDQEPTGSKQPDNLRFLPNFLRPDPSTKIEPIRIFDDISTDVSLDGRLRKLFPQSARKSISDRLERLKDAENQIAQRLGLARLPSDMSAYDAENLMHSKAQKLLEDFETQYVETIAESVKAADLSLDQVGLYLLARHAPERNAVIAQKERDLRAAQVQRLQDQIEAANAEGESTAALEQRLSVLNEAPFRFQETGSGLTDQQAQQVIDRAETDGKSEALEGIADQVYKMLDDMRENMVKKQLLDEQTREDWEDTYQFYVPLKGFASYPEGQEMRSGVKASGFSIRGSESFKAKGRVTLPVNPLLEAFKDAEDKIIRGERNVIAQRLLSLFEANPSTQWEVFNNRYRPDDPDDPSQKLSLGRMKTERRKDDGLFRFIQVKRGGQTFFIEVKDRELNRQLQSSGVGMFNASVDFMNKVYNTLTKFQNFRRNMLINYNPSWGLVNPIRDVQTGLAFALSEQDVAGGRIEGKELVGKISAGYFPALKSFWRNRRGTEGKTDIDREYDQFTKEYVEDGAPTGLSLTKSLAEQQRRFERIVKQGDFKKKLRAIGDYVEDYNQTMENAVRLSTYVEARKAGVARSDAATLAKDLTVNFNRKGEYSSAIDSMYLFFNAAVQGNVNIAKALLRPAADGSKVTRARLLAASMVALGFARTLMNIDFGGEDDDGEPKYADFNEYVLKTSMVIMSPFTDSSQGFAIPMPYGYGIFDNIGRYGAELVAGVKDPGEITKDLMLSVDHHFNPLSLHAAKDDAGFIDASLQMGIGILPDILEQGAEQLGNINFFGSDITIPQNSFLVEKPPSEPTKRGTNEYIAGVTQWLNALDVPFLGIEGGNEDETGTISANPEKLEYFMQFLLGGVGRFFDDSSDSVAKLISEEPDLKSNDLPILRTFLPLPSEFSDRIEFYDNRDSFRQTEKRFNSLDRKEQIQLNKDRGYDIGRFARFDGRIEKELRSLRDRKYRLERDELMDPLKRFERIQEIAEREEFLYDVYNKRYREEVK